jgi:replication-associated recombination protein RarA
MIKDIKDFVFHDQETKDRVMMLINNSNIFPAARKGIILYGAYGCGKTTLSRLMPRAIDNARKSTFCFDMDLELACSASEYRSQLRDVNSELEGNIFRSAAVKFVLFDEFDNYGDKQTEFKSVMTNPFIGFFITTNDLSKITPSVQSRCHLVELKQPSVTVWENYAKEMFALRNVPLTNADIQNAIRSARTLSQRDMTATLEILLYTKQQEPSAA